MSLFESGRDLIRASIVSTFGKSYIVTFEGVAIEVLGYVKKTERDGVTSFHFYSDEKIQIGSRLLYNGKSYSLAFAGMASNKSQIMREYVMSLPVKNQPHGGVNGWSEFKDVP